MITVDDSGQAYWMANIIVRLAAQEGFSEDRTHLLTPDQTRWVPVTLLLFSVNAFVEQSLSHYEKQINLTP
jgi:hypothetical protein